MLALEFSDLEQSYSAKDLIFYALSIGLGEDPLAREQLKFVYERDLQAFPSMFHILAMDADWLFDPENGVDLSRLLHLESGLTVHHSLPPSGTVASRMRIAAILDQGEGKGAIIRFERDIRAVGSDMALATVTGTFLLRGMGGFGGATPPRPSLSAIPERAPDHVCDLITLPRAALLYRLNHDMNPIHVDPDMAQVAGFDRPLLHGACTYAVACHAFVRTVCGYDASRLHRFDVRFSAPVFPGDTLRSEFWEIGNKHYVFTCRALERDVVVLNGGLAAQY